MIEYQKALEIILENTPGPQEVIEVPLSESLGHTLAKDICSDVDLPPFNKSGMDGFAVQAADVANTPSTLDVIMDIPAGGMPRQPIGPGQAASVMTGAPVPEGSDAVVMVEWTSGFGSDTVTINQGVAKGRNVSPLGEILKTGEVALKAGTCIDIEEIGLLAAVGADPVPVFRKPTAAVLSTGDELVAPGAKPGPGQIRNTNGPTLLSYLQSLGLNPVDLGQVNDDPDAMFDALSKGLAYDCLLLSGGVSAGAYDFVEDVLEKLGVEAHLRRVAIKPGKPTVFGTHHQNRMVFGLPGNPVSATVISRLMVGPALLKRLGRTQTETRTIKARLVKDFKKKPDRLWFVPGILKFDGDRATVEPLKNRGSADLPTSMQENCLVMGPKGVSLIEKGAIVDVIVWDRWI